MGYQQHLIYIYEGIITLFSMECFKDNWRYLYYAQASFSAGPIRLSGLIAVPISRTASGKTDNHANIFLYFQEKWNG